VYTTQIYTGVTLSIALDNTQKHNWHQLITTETAPEHEHEKSTSKILRSIKLKKPKEITAIVKPVVFQKRLLKVGLRNKKPQRRNTFKTHFIDKSIKPLKKEHEDFII